ncbi:MAG: exopolysaccharide biosynthesis protein [Methylophaga sp.]|nr:exopolysaccharide biosynthesis protein [Methylophaga sp.]
MGQNQSVNNLQQLLDCIAEAAQEKQVTLDAIMDMVGRRSFGTLLLVAGLLILAPIVGDIPGVPTIIGLFVFLIAIQMLLGSEHFWLPKWLLNRSISSEKLLKALDLLHKPVRYIDRLIKPRLQNFVNGAAKYAIALVCITIALCMPVMEVVPFSANAAGLVLLAFGLGLIARDGLLALFSFVITGLTFTILAFNIF